MNNLMPNLFNPNDQEARDYGRYRLETPALFAKPGEVPDDYIAYNPSSIWTVFEPTGSRRDIMYVREEPNRSDAQTSHLGKSKVRPYMVNPTSPSTALTPYYEADEYVGEDAAITRINRRLPSGKLEEVWLVSYVDPTPFPDKPNAVQSLCTRFYVGYNLANLEHIADGPAWMKDIRITRGDGPLGTELEVYGRPQPQPFSGNITHTTLASIEDLNAETIAAAPYIDENLLPIGKNVWGGVNDVVRLTTDKYILAAHRAWNIGADNRSRHYESVLYGHNVRTKRIVELGVIATADMFPGRTTKDDTAVDLSDVVFTGGGYNGRLDFMTFGVSDGGIGIGSLRQLHRPE